MKKQASRFGGRLALLSWLKVAKHNITETQTADRGVTGLASSNGARYDRFDIPEDQTQGDRKLSGIELDECKRSRKQSSPSYAGLDVQQSQKEALEHAAERDKKLRRDRRLGTPG